MYHITRFENGLTLATAAMPHMASVSVGIWVGVGGRYEPARWSGVSHFIEHMLFKGTRRRSAKKISEDVEGIGGSSNAFTGEENTCFFARARHDRLEDLLEVLMDMFLNSQFAPEEIAKEREVIKEELAMYLDQPHQHVQELLNETQWPDHPLGRSITGTEQTLEGLARLQLLHFKKANYLAANTHVVVAGNLEHRDVAQLVKRFNRGFVPGSRPGYVPFISSQVAPRVRLLTRELEQTQIALGIRTCSRHDERRYALRLLNTLLGENSSSCLFQVLREDRGLIYSIGSTLSFFDDIGDLVIAAGLDAGQLEETLRLIQRELRRLATKPPAAAELRRALDYVIGQFDLSLENTENHMLWLGEQLLSYGKFQTPDEIKQNLMAVTPRAICAAARDFFQPAQMNLALVSPLKNAARVEKWLRTGWQP